MGTRPARDSRARQRAGHAWPSSAGHDGPGTPRRHPPGHDGPRPNGPPSQRARHARRVNPAHALRSRPTNCAGKPPNAGRQLRRWRARRSWRTAAGGSCQAMRVRPTPGSPGTLGCMTRLKVGGCRAASRPERIAGEIAPSPRTAPAVSAAQPGWGARAYPLARPLPGREHRGELIPARPVTWASAGWWAADRTIARHGRPSAEAPDAAPPSVRPWARSAWGLGPVGDP